MLPDQRMLIHSALAAIQQLTQAGIVVACGHADADYDTIEGLHTGNRVRSAK